MTGQHMERRPGNKATEASRGAATARAGAAPGHGSAKDMQATMLIERLASFLKACFIYPDNNQRVQATGEMVLEALREYFAHRPIVEIVVGSHDLVVCTSRLPLRSHAQTWLRDLFVKSLIGGVEFTPAVDMMSLTAAARRLQRSQIGKERGLAVWADPIAGVRARDLVMTGSHCDGDGEAEGAPDTLSGSRSARSRALEATLADSARVRAKLEELRAALPQQSEAGENVAVIDVIAELVQCLPAEASHDHAYAEALAEKILAAAHAELTAVAGGAALDRDALAGTFLSVGRKMFAATLGGEQLPPTGGRGHGDEAVVDSLEDLLADLNRLEEEERNARGHEDWIRDIQSLQATTSSSTTRGLAELDATELIGIVLHALTQDGALHEATVRSYLVRALQTGGEVVRTLFSDYFASALAGDDVDQRPAWRLVQIAGDPVVTAALQDAKLLEPEQVAQQFPKTFGLFLDTLHGPDAAQRLARLCRAVDPATILASTSWFEKNPDTLNEARVDRLFSCLSPRALALATLALRHAKSDCKAAATKFLRQAGLTGPASVALRVVDPASRLPREYLEKLCEQVASERPASEELVALSGSVTRAFIQDVAGNAEQEARRIFAIQSLRELPSIETRVLLTDLVTSGGLLFKRESRAVRRVARATLETMGRKRG
ncbi:MAG: hypothetical protein R3F56_25480 [Planctomycetota bacterium]